MRIQQFVSGEAVEHLIGVLLLSGLDGAILDANSAALECYGYSLDEIRLLNIRDIREPADHVHLEHDIQTAIDHEHRYERWHRRSDGTSFPVDVAVKKVAADGETALLASVSDITTRKNVEAALRDSEQRFEELFDRAPLGYQSLDAEGRFVEVNSAWLETFGYAREDIIGAWFGELVAPEFVDVYLERFSEFKRKGTERCELEMIHQDGTRRTIAFDGRIGRNQDGSFKQTHCILTDVSESRRAEQELRVYAELLDTSPAAIAVHTREGEFLYANARASELHGYSRDEFMALNLRDLVVAQDAALFDERLGEVVDKGENSFEVVHFRKDGSTFPLAVNTRRESWDGRDVILAVSTDITERRRADAELLESRNMMVNLTAQVPGVVYQYRLRPDGSSCFPWSSSGMDDIYEVSPEEVREDATPVFDRLHPQDRDRVAAALQESARTLEPFHAEFRVVLPRQGLRWRGCDALPESADDGGTLWHGIVFDITERKESARALVQSAERHRAILETAMDGYWLVDMDGYLLEVNQAYSDMSGYSEEELLHMSVFDLETTRATEDVISHLQKIRAEGEDRFETQHRRNDGSLFDVEISVRYQPTAGGRFAAFLRDITESKLAADRLARSLASVIEVVGQVVETRDPYTAGHERRVSQLAMCVAREMGMSPRQVEEIRVSALIHDVGKISVPAEILSKPGKLSAIEFELIKGHAESGYSILAAADMDSGITEMVHQHHERCDGSGYPRGLSEHQLVDGAKVLMVADVVEAMISHRPYRPGLGLDAALAEIERGAGLQYDAAVVRACLACFHEHRFAFSDT